MIALLVVMAARAAEGEPGDEGGEGDEGWLDAARPEDTPSEQTPEDPPADPGDEPVDPGEEPVDPDAPLSERGTFGAQLDLLGLQVSWSGYGDLVFEWAPTEREVTFEASHFNPIVGARLSEELYAELELEFEDSGTEIKVEYGILDYTPVDAFGLRIGQFLVPIGEFNETLHPSFRWVQVTRPAMFRDVVPAVWSETGIQVRGAVPTGDLGRLKYAAYLANGLGSAFDPTLDEPIRAMRANAEDTNYDLAYGGQVGFTVRPGELGETGISVSGYRGGIDPTGEQTLTIADLALSTRLGPVTLRGEAARNFLNHEDDPLDPFEQGLYAQAAVTIGRVTPSIRYDLVSTGLQAAETETVEGVAGTVLVKVATFWNLRAEGVATFEHGEIEPELQLMSAFFF